MPKSFVVLKLILISITITTNSFASEEFKLQINRIFENENCSISEIYINGTLQMYGLEKPWKDNKKFISSIPTNCYKGIIRYDKTERWGNSSILNRWRIELFEVLNRSDIQIHIGNYPKDTEGCILVGTIAWLKNNKITYSESAFNKLKNLFYGSADPIMSPNKHILVCIDNNKTNDSIIYNFNNGYFRIGGYTWQEYRNNKLVREYVEQNRNMNHIKIKSPENYIVWLPVTCNPLGCLSYIKKGNQSKESYHKIFKVK